MRPLRPAVRSAIAAVMIGALASACAPIETRSSVRIEPRPNARPLLVGPPTGQVSARGAAVAWDQQGQTLLLSLSERRTCNLVRHVPMTRVETIERRATGGALYFEYGFGAAALSLGLAGLIKPEAFARPSIDSEGRSVPNKRPGYQIGGIFTGIAAVVITTAIIDTVRSRDEERYLEVYRREPGATVKCRDPLAPLADRTVELVVGDWTARGRTDAEGNVELMLPARDELPPKVRAALAKHDAWAQREAERSAANDAATDDAATETPDTDTDERDTHNQEPETADDTEAPATDDGAPADRIAELPARKAPRPFRMPAAVRLDGTRAIPLYFVLPYEDDRAHGYSGQAALEPVPIERAPTVPTDSADPDDRETP